MSHATETTMATISGSAQTDDWSLEITPRSDLFRLPLGDIWRYRDLLWLFVRRDFVSFYKQTILGPFWFFIQPIFTTLIFTVVFGKVGGLAPDGVDPMLFYLCSVTFWNYFAECLNKTATTFKDNANLFGKVYFPRLIVPLSIVLSNLLKFGVQFLLFLGVLAWMAWRGKATPDILSGFVFLPVVAIMGLMGLGIGMLFSAMTTKYRDLVFLLQFGVQLLMYGSAVIFSWDRLQEKADGYPWIERILAWNPLIPLVETVRCAFLGMDNPFGSMALVYPFLFATFTFLLASVVFNRVEKTFMDTV